MASVALVVLDTLRKDYFDEYFDWMPGMHFENAWTTSHYTVPCHASLFTGKYPREIGVHSKSETFDCENPSLAEKLNNGGYYTKAISANVLASSINNFDRGFNEVHYTGRAVTLNDDVFPWNERAEELNPEGILENGRLVLECLSSNYKTWKSLVYGWKIKTSSYHSAKDTAKVFSRERVRDKEFLFINMMDAHAPYLPPEKYRSTEDDITTNQPIIESNDGAGDNNIEFEMRKRAYEDAVRYLSDKYKEIFNMLIDEYDYVITLSDHGELLGEYNMSNHPFGVYPELVNIPLCISSNKFGDSSEMITEAASILDVHKTILEITGIDGESRGQDLLDSPKGGTYLVESHGIRQPTIENLKQRGFDAELINRIDKPLRGIVMPEDYYGYQTPDGDYLEIGNAAITDPKSELNRLDDAITEKDYIDDNPEHREISEDVESQLRDLGYM